MKNAAFLFFFLLFAVSLNASSVSNAAGREKTALEGFVTDEKGVPLEGANVLVTDTLRRIQAAGFTQADGSFSVTPPYKGTYTVQISFIGFQTFSRRWNYEGKSEHWGRITLVEGADLRSATVVARPLLRRESDRIVYDVAKDPDAFKTNMATLFKKIPGLRMTSGNGLLAYKDEPIGTILIDDEDNALINVRRQYPMSFIQAAYMRKVELILPGSPEYNNSAPMLVIRLREPLPVGAAAELNVEGNNRGSFRTGADAVANTPWGSWGVGYSFHHDAPPELKDRSSRTRTLSDADGILRQESLAASGSKNQSNHFHLGYSHSFIERKLWGNAMLDGNTTRSKEWSHAETDFFGSGTDPLFSVLSRSSSQGSSPMRLNGAASLTHVFGKINNKQRFQYSYQDNESHSATTLEQSAPLGALPGTRDQFARNRTHNANYLLTLRIPSWNIGWMTYAGFMYRRYETSASESGKMDYLQRIPFAETTVLGRTAGNKLSYSVRLKVENVQDEGRFIQDETPSEVHHKEWHLLPYATLTWVQGRNNIGLNWITSVRRPGIDRMNPYIRQMDPMNLRMGNPNLKGSRSQEFSLLFGRAPEHVKWIQSVSMNGTYGMSRNEISSITSLRDDGVSVTTWQNIGRTQSVGAGFSVRMVPVERVNISLKANYLNSKYSFNESNKKRSLNTVSASLIVSALNIKGFDLSSILVVRPSLASVQRIETRMEPLWRVELSRYFEKPHLGVSLAADDLFHSNSLQRSTLLGDGFIQYNERQRLGRTFNVLVYWRIGKFKKLPDVDNTAYDM